MQEFSHSLPMMLYRTLDAVMPRFRQIFSEFETFATFHKISLGSSDTELKLLAVMP